MVSETINLGSQSDAITVRPLPAKLNGFLHTMENGVREPSLGPETHPKYFSGFMWI